MNKIIGIIESSYPPDRNNILWVDKGVLKYFRNGSWVTIGEGAAGITELEEKVDDLDKEMGDVKLDLLKFGSSQGVVELQIGNSPDIKSHNIKILQSIQSTDHTFFTDIDYGYGTGQWLPTTGGGATIFTSAGHMVNYSISSDGAVTKLSEGIMGGQKTFTIRQSRFEGPNMQAVLTAEEISELQQGVDVIILTSDADAPMFYAYKTLGDGIATDMWTTNGVVVEEGEITVLQLSIEEGKLILSESAVNPKATTTTYGTVKQIVAPAELPSNSEIAQVISRVNTIISSLVSSGVFKGV